MNMDPDIQATVQQVHDSPYSGVLAATGAGTKALAWLFGVAGASRTVLEASVPYSAPSMESFIGRLPSQAVSKATALDMAEAAYFRALGMEPDNERLFGLGCTATIATDRTKRGEHRCWVATRDTSGFSTYGLTLVKGARDRDAEEEVISRLLLHALAGVCGLPHGVALGLLDSEHLEQSTERSPLAPLLAADPEVDRLLLKTDGSLSSTEKVTGGVFPGAFNPLHDGHRKMAAAASVMLGGPITFELSVINVDKPPLEELEIYRRLTQFRGKWPIALTKAPRFRMKARLFPGCTFIVGWDTAIRLVDPVYYDNDETEIRRALEEMADLGCSFLVAGRKHGESFRTLADVEAPSEAAHLFREIPESLFRADLSSTEIRAGGSG